MGYQHGASMKVAARVRRNSGSGSGNSTPPLDELANGFDEGWETLRNENGTRNAGKADRNALLAYLAFHGKEAFEGYRGTFRFAKDRIRVREVDYKIPQHGILAHFTFEGRDKLRQISDVKGPWEDYHSDTREVDSERKRIGRMLSGMDELHPGWLEMLGYGLGLNDAARRNLWQLFGSAKVVPGPDSEESRAIANFIEQHAQRSVGHLEFAERRTASELVDVWRQRIDHFAAVPEGYGETLSVPVLAQMLSAANLEEGWEKDYEGVQGLYSSGMSHYGSMSALEAVADGRRIMVLGDPGHGKSTLLAGAALSASEQGSPVIFGRLEDLGAAAVASRSKPKWCLPSDRGLRWASEMLLEAAIESGLLILENQWEMAVRQIIADQDLLVVLDGWDEVSTEVHRSGAEDVLKLLGGAGSTEDSGIPGRVILASRVTGYRRPMAGLREVLVTLLDPASVRRFFQTWFEGEESADALVRVRKALENPKLAELARIPVLAGFIAVVAKDDNPRPSKQGLYEQYLDRFLARAWKDGRFVLRSYSEIQERLRVAATVAWKMATWPSSDPYRIDQWEDHLTIKELGTWSTSEKPDSSSQWYRKVEDLAVQDGLLVPHGGLLDARAAGRQRYRWLHRTIHEHLVGRHLMELVRANPNEGLASIRQVILRPSWEEAIEHATGFLAQERLADAVIEDLWAYRSERDIGGWVTGQIVLIAIDTAASLHRSDLLAELFSDGEYLLAGKLDPSETIRQIEKRLDRVVSAADADDMALALIKISGPEALELARKICRAAEPYAHAAQRVLEEKLLEIDPEDAQRHAIEAYSNGDAKWISESTFPGASRHIADLLLQRIRESTSAVEWGQYLGALAARGSKEGGGRSGHIDSESRELLHEALTQGADKDFLMSFLDHRINTPTWYETWDWIALDLRHELATQEDVAPVFAFIAGGYVKLKPPSDWVLSPWARVGYAVGAISSDETFDVEAEWTRERAESAIAVALASPLATAPAVVEEFHWAVKWGLDNAHVATLGSALEVLNRNYEHHPKWTWCWDSYGEYASRLAQLPWSVQWEVWKQEVRRCSPKLPNLDLGGWISNLTPEERGEKLLFIARWWAEESPDGFNWFPIAHQDMSRNKDTSLAVHAQALMSLVTSCRTKDKAMKLLEVSASWHRAADTLEHFWGSITSTRDSLCSDGAGTSPANLPGQ